MNKSCQGQETQITFLVIIYSNSAVSNIDKDIKEKEIKQK